ncbi:MAG: KEOPS complex subunit Pcc1 [Nitrososphaerales archaeon]
MISKINLEITSLDQNLLKALYNALYPDNTNLPKGLHIRMDLIGCKMIIEVKSESKFETLISTIEEMLEDINSALDSINVVKT